jgi:ankyrin repeat protein
MKRAVLAVVCLIGFLQAQTAEDAFRAIRANDLDALRHLPANIKDRLNTTPLHYAALYGSTESVRITEPTSKPATRLKRLR